MALELSGFVIGVSNILPVVEKSFEIWKSISDTKGFGSDLVGIAAQLSMEYYRFLTWAKVSQALLPSAASDQSNPPSPLAARGQTPTFPFGGSVSLNVQVQAPILDAAARIVSILEEVSKIVDKYAIPSDASPAFHRTAAAKGSSEGKSISQALGSVLPIIGVSNTAITSAMSQHRRSASQLQKRTSFRVKLTFGSKPWGEPDKKTLEEKVKELCYWNDRLEGLLPKALSNTIMQQAIPGQILRDENQGILEDLMKAADNQNEAVKLHARLWKERIAISNGTESMASMTKKYRRPPSDIIRLSGLPSSRCRLSLTTLNNKGTAPVLATVEWYSYSDVNWEVNDLEIATKRLGELVHMTSLKDRPKSLRILEGLGFVDDGKALGYICRIPDNTNSTKQPISLFSLLRRDQDSRGFRPPELGERLLLAQNLAESIYSFSLVRWFHKDLNSHNVTFFRDSSPSAAILFGSPFVTGFSLARPDNEGEKSLDKDREHLAIYLHPDLRVSGSDKPPRYSRKHELYALGLLLFEIAIWRPVEDIVKESASFPPTNLAHLVADRARKDLGFYVGNRYRDVVLHCLSLPEDGENESVVSLDTMYWSVVLELAKCR